MPQREYRRGFQFCSRCRELLLNLIRRLTMLQPMFFQRVEQFRATFGTARILIERQIGLRDEPVTAAATRSVLKIGFRAATEGLDGYE